MLYDLGYCDYLGQLRLVSETRHIFPSRARQPFFRLTPKHYSPCSHARVRTLWYRFRCFGGGGEGFSSKEIMQEIRHEHNWKQASKYITIHKVSQHVPTKASKIHSSSKTNTPNCTTIKFNTINLLSAHNQKFQRPPFFSYVTSYPGSKPPSLEHC